MESQTKTSDTSSTPAPFLDTFRREMDQVFDRIRGTAGLNQLGLHIGNSGQIIPAIDLVDIGDAIEITAEVPGVAAEDLDVTLHGDAVVLTGEKKSQSKEQAGDYMMTERSYGRFRRQIPLGFTPEDGAVDASFEGGLLVLRIAKPAVVKEGIRKIQIATK